MPLQMHDCGRMRRVIKRRELTGHPPQLIARHEELAREGVREPLPAVVTAGHRNHDVLGVKVGMSKNDDLLRGRQAGP